MHLPEGQENALLILCCISDQLFVMGMWILSSIELYANFAAITLISSVKLFIMEPTSYKYRKYKVFTLYHVYFYYHQHDPSICGYVELSSISDKNFDFLETKVQWWIYYTISSFVSVGPSLIRIGIFDLGLVFDTFCYRHC